MNTWITRLGRGLLRAYPPEFRSEYGPDLLQVFTERFTEERGASRCRFCVETVADVLVTAAKERYQVLHQEIRQSCRRLKAHPAITLVAVASLALGIGANTTVFSILHAALLRPLPYTDADRRVVIHTGPVHGPFRNVATTADFVDWKAASSTLEDWQMFSVRYPVTARGAGLPERIRRQYVTPGLLESLGVQPVAGRFFRSGEEAGYPAVISEGYWRRRFEGSADVLGKKLAVGPRVFTIVGVAPAGFEFFDEPSGIDLWTPIDLAPGSEWLQRRVPWLMATAKLRQGVTPAQAQAELNLIAAGLARAYPESNAQRGIAIESMTQAMRGNPGALLFPLFGAVGFVLLIACTNVANLLLARSTARLREISIRAALGAGRMRLIRELLFDGLVLAVPAVIAAIALAYGGLELFRQLAPAGYPGQADVEMNAAVLWFTACAGTLAGLLSAAFPALSASKADLTESLKEGGRGSGGRSHQRLRSLLVTGEVALALVLLAGAGLMIGTVFRMQGYELGFDPNRVTVAELFLTGPGYMSPAPRREIDMLRAEPAVTLFIDDVLRKTRNLPGVESAALAGTVPMGPTASSAGTRLRIAGTPESAAPLPGFDFNVVTSGYFETLRIPLRRGRYFHNWDTEGSQWVAVVNEAFAREFFPQGDALRQEITVIAAPGERPRKIVGVVADHTQYTPRMPVRPEVYTSYQQQPVEIPGPLQGQRLRPKLLVRTQPGVTIEARKISEIVASFDPQLAVLDVTSLTQHISLRDAPTRFHAYALGLFAAIAILLAAVGIYGLMHYSVADRSHEIGIRLSLGASRGQIVWLIVSSGLKLVLLGVAFGLIGATAATRLLEGFLFGLKPNDPFTFLVVTAITLAVSLSASAVPAWRAAQIDPAITLRRE